MNPRFVVAAAGVWLASTCAAFGQVSFEQHLCSGQSSVLFGLPAYFVGTCGASDGESEWHDPQRCSISGQDLAKSEEIEFGLGLTAKIRDARIRLSGGGASSTKTDLGFVPLINVRFLWNASSTVGFLVEADALAAPQGRAEDVMAAVVLRPTESYTMRAGYRILEGGADNDKVYSFSLFNYAVLGVAVTL